MAARASVRELVQAFLNERRPARIGREEWSALEARLAGGGGQRRPVSARRILEVLHETDLEIDRALGGLPPDLRDRVRTRTPEAAAESLLAMSTEYAHARAAGDAVRAEDVRRAVRQAKDRLRLTFGRKNLREETRRQKGELLEWFLVWLENPGVFPAWLSAKRGRKQGAL